MATSSTDFLRFSAYSIKDLITKKLSQDTKFTDQIYEGSNLAILIDLFSYMAQCMLYSLNTAAAESMFSDTQIYENMSRLVKFLGYNPKGIIPSNATFILHNVNGIYNGKYVPEFAYVDTGRTDKNGNTIYFSVAKPFEIDENDQYMITLVNGIWKKSSDTYVATGNDYETFELDNIGSSIADDMLVANNQIKVYVENPIDGKIVEWERTDFEIFTHNTADPLNFARIYSNESKIFSVHLNERKQYEIKFGNGILGKKLNKGDIVHVFYLQTNGMDGEIDRTDMTTEQLNLTYNAADNSSTDDEMMRFNSGIFPTEKDQIIQSIPVTLASNFSQAKAEETVEEIRQNAPEWFKLGQRLVTTEDYKYYMINVCDTKSIIDCHVQNNYEYMTTFYKWLYELGLNGKLTDVKDNARNKDGKYYINEARLIKYDYAFSDPADANNVYIWLKLNNMKLSNVVDLYASNIERLKTATAEVVFLEPISVNFSITAMPEQKLLKHIADNNLDKDTSYIEVTLENDALYTSAAIKNKIQSIIVQYFNPYNNRLGAKIDYHDILSKIYSLNGVKNVRTVYVDEETGNVNIRDGLSFATWSGSYIDPGDDLDVSNVSKTLYSFQFPTFVAIKNFIDKIVVIKKSLNNINKLII